MKNASLLPTERSSPESGLPICTAFEGHRRIASGALAEVARQIKAVADRGEHEPVLVFDDLTGELMEIDLRGTADEVADRISRSEKAGATMAGGPQKRGPGRPKLGVIAREVTLLPGQWDWLDEQPGGASAALRRLVYEAKRSSHGKDRARRSQEAVYRFMTTMAGDFPGFEEALRAFYRRDHPRFDGLVAAWPKDVRHYVKQLVAIASRDQASVQLVH
ncbi:MAG TPA: DUF2239 family protein [Dongiaceae bacterium]|nr:DUF2239 family protein [Dongiaceae bacterium]